MEEQKKSSKVVKMNPSSIKEENTPKKYSYDELNNICNQLMQQNQNLLKQLQNMNIGNMFRRLDYLFKVVEYGNAFNDADFVGACVDEIKDLITIPKQEETKEEE